MTVVVTRDVEPRYRGFLASVMLEVAPGTYVSPTMNAGVRERTWRVIENWHGKMGRGSLTMISKDGSAPSGLALNQVGIPPIELCEVDGLWLARRELKLMTDK